MWDCDVLDTTVTCMDNCNFQALIAWASLPTHFLSVRHFPCILVVGQVFKHGKWDAEHSHVCLLASWFPLVVDN